MDKINLKIENGKRVFSVGISQAMHVAKLVDEFIEENLNTEKVLKFYIGTDFEYARSIGFTEFMLDYYTGRLVSPVEIKFENVKPIPECDTVIIYLDSFIDESLMRSLLMNVGYTTKLIYIYDNLVVDYSDGTFYRRFYEPDCSINTYNRRPDVKFGINALLNKLKKYTYKYLTDPELQCTNGDDYTITYEQVKDEELLDYDKIILINSDDVSDYNIRVRRMLSRPFSPVERDKMINYTPMCVSAHDVETGITADLEIPIYSELTVLEKIRDAAYLTPPIYKFKYIRDEKEYEFETVISTSFINEMNDCSVPLEDEDFLTHQGYKLYFAYAIPLYAVTKRYNSILLVATDEIINKSLVYSGIRFAKNKFKLIYETNVYIGQ